MDPAVVTTLVILAVAVVIVNTFCLIVIGTTPSIRRPSVVAVGSLLFTHLLQGLIVIPTYTLKRWKLENPIAKTVVCDLFRFSYMVTNYASCLTLLVIGIDRLIAASKPLNYTQIVTKKRMFGILVVTWIYVLILCCLPFIPLERKTKCHYNYRKHWTIGMLLGNTLLPCLIITGCYLYIFKIARNVIRRRISRKPLQANSRKKVGFRASTSLREISAAKMSLVIVIAYDICWGPSFFYYLILTLWPSSFPEGFMDSETEQVLGFLMKTLTFVDCLVAPSVYCYKHSGFRTALRKLRSKIAVRRPHCNSMYAEPTSSVTTGDSSC